ncbi:MAG TPA: TolC family protein [Bryobacteraceae bacterium]|nr:TolC family protein [Bryobacteraceae bacterium]
MKCCRSFLAAFCGLLTLLPASGAEIISAPRGVRGTRKYNPPGIAPVDLSNSNRLEQLLRAGNLYLSLQDTVALVLENNLDIAISRYGPIEAQTDLLRSQGGGALRGVTQTVTPGPASAGLSLNAFSSGGSSLSIPSTSTGVNGVVSQLGTLIPNYDPQLSGFVGWGHSTSPQSTPFLYGTTSLVTTQTNANFTLSEGFSTGATASLQFQNQRSVLNSGRPDLNPLIASSLTLTISQPLLSGFGFAVNRRGIRQAENSLRVQDLVFKQQVMTTVASVVSLYWNLVSFNEQVKVAQEALAASQKLYEDNKKQVEIGTLARISIVQAEAEVASREQDLTVAETNVLQQETILKNVLSKNGVASPSIADAHIITLDRIRVPEAEPIQPVQDLITTALQQRPELPQDRLNIENAKLSILGDRSNLLPQLSAVASLANNGQAGVLNSLPPLPGNVRAPDPYFFGGYWNNLAQVFARNFPNYTFGVQLNIPLRDRAATADYARDTLNLRQSQLALQEQENQVRVDVVNAVIGLQQARARYQAAVKNQVLEEETLDAEQKKFALGASTLYNVILIQRDLLTAEGNQVTAESNYINARNNLDFVTGEILDVNHINIAEAQSGQVSAPPSRLPAEKQ